MLTVNFVLKNNSNALTLVFKAYKNADEAYKKILNSTSKLELEDDFETKIAIDMGDVAAVSISDYEKDMDKHGELQIIQHKSTLKMQNKAKNDVGLRLLDSAANSVSQ